MLVWVFLRRSESIRVLQAAHQAMIDTGLTAYFPAERVPFEVVPNMLARMLAASTLDLRRIAQSIRHLSLICAPLNNYSSMTAAAASAGLLLRKLDANLYAAFCKSECSDDDVVQKIYTNGELGSIQNSKEGHVFEAIVCSIWCERSSEVRGYNTSIEQSPLLSRYNSALGEMHRRQDEARRSGPRIEFTEEEMARQERYRGVVNAARMISDVRVSGAFRDALMRVELLPGSDADETR